MKRVLLAALVLATIAVVVFLWLSPNEPEPVEISHPPSGPLETFRHNRQRQIQRDEQEGAQQAQPAQPKR